MGLAIGVITELNCPADGSGTSIRRILEKTASSGARSSVGDRFKNAKKMESARLRGSREQLSSAGAMGKTSRRLPKRQFWEVT